MNNTPSAPELYQALDQLLETMIEQQHAKVLKTARRLRPNCTEDDIQDPHSIPEIIARPEFSYEDGILAGLVSARVAIHREARETMKKRD